MYRTVEELVDQDIVIANALLVEVAAESRAEKTNDLVENLCPQRKQMMQTIKR